MYRQEFLKSCNLLWIGTELYDKIYSFDLEPRKVLIENIIKGVLENIEEYEASENQSVKIHNEFDEYITVKVEYIKAKRWDIVRRALELLFFEREINKSTTVIIEPY